MAKSTLSEPNTKSYYLVYAPIFEKIESYVPHQITPNMISCTSFILLTTLFLTKSYYNPYIFSACLFIYWILDNIDGIHARNTKQTSTLGEILDHCGDAYYQIIILYMFFNLFQIKIDKWLIVFGALFINLKHLLSFYTNELSLKIIDLPKLGIEFGVDDLLLVAAFLPFLKIFVNFKVHYQSVQWVLYALYALYLILGLVSIQNIMMLLKLPKLNKMYLLGTLLLPIFYYFIIQWPILIGMIQSLYILFLILQRTAK